MDVIDRLADCDPNSRDIVDCLISIFSSQKDIKHIFELQSPDALRFMNIIDQVLDSPHLDDRLRGKCFLALRKVSGGCGELPTSHIITGQLELSEEGPYAGGGFADVWKGMYRSKQVAVKIFRIYRTDDMSKVKKKFCKEAVTWKWLRHPNVLPFLGVSYDRGHKLAIVSEWMPHGSIVQFLKSHPEANRLKLLLDVSRGLQFLHSRRVIHGDLKGENILINNNFDSCLADFGLASFCTNAFSVAVTISETTGGTLRWMAPELINADSSDLHLIQGGQPASDIYSLGMVALEVFTGNVPFHRSRSQAVIFQVKAGARPDRPDDAAPLGLSDDVWAAMELCWRHSQEERPKIESLITCFEKAFRNFVPDSTIARLLSVSAEANDEAHSEVFTLYNDRTLDSMPLPSPPQNNITSWPAPFEDGPAYYPSHIDSMSPFAKTSKTSHLHEAVNIAAGLQRKAKEACEVLCPVPSAPTDGYTSAPLMNSSMSSMSDSTLPRASL